MLVTVAIPAFNRPEMLREGLQSVARQTYPEWEVVVVDDGSQPPIPESLIAESVGDRYRLIRHKESKGVSAAKNAGVREARGDVILHLDDDDMLRDNALEIVVDVLKNNEDIDCVFMNIATFGSHAEASGKIQDATLDRLLCRVKTESRDKVLVFDQDDLFAAFLDSVPLSCQRPVARRKAWDTVGEMLETLYFGEPDWAIRAAATCRIGIVLDKVSLWRVDGQNYASTPNKKPMHIENAIDTKKNLMSFVKNGPPELRRRLPAARSSLANAYFSKAYYYSEKDTKKAWVALFSAFLIKPQWVHLKYSLRLFSNLFVTGYRSGEGDG